MATNREQNPDDILNALRKISQQTSQPAKFQSRRYTPPSQGVRDRQMGVHDARIAALRANPAMRPLIDELAAGKPQPSGTWGTIGRALFDNPATKLILAPLAAVDTGRRAMISGVRELVDVFDSDPNTTGSLSDFRKQTMDTSYGFGTAFPMSGAKGRIIGFLGDVALDPLTWATLGSAIPAKALIQGTSKAVRAELGFKRIMGFDARAQLARKSKEFGASDVAVKEIAARGRAGLFKYAPEVAEKMGINRPGIYYFGSRLRVPLSGPLASALENGLATTRLAFFNTKRGAAIGAALTTTVGSRAFGDTSQMRFSLATGKVSDPAAATRQLFFLSDIEAATGVVHMQYDTAVKRIREIEADPDLVASKETIYRFLDVPEDRWPDLIGRAPTPAEAAAIEKTRLVFKELRDNLEAVYKSIDPDFPGFGEFGAYFPHVITEDMAKLMDEAVSPWAKMARQYFKLDLSEAKGSFASRNARAGMEWFGEAPDRPYILTEADVLGGVDRLNELSMQFVGIKAFETDIVEAMSRYAGHYADMMGRAEVAKRGMSRPWTGGRAQERMQFDEARLAEAVEELRVRERAVTLANDTAANAIADALKVVDQALASLVRSGSSTVKAGPLRQRLSDLGKALPPQEAAERLAKAKGALETARATLQKKYDDLAAQFDEAGEQLEGIVSSAQVVQQQIEETTKAIDGAIAAYTTNWGDEVIRQDALKKAMDEVKENLATVDTSMAKVEQDWAKRLRAKAELEKFLDDLTKDPELVLFSDDSGLGLPLPFRTVRSLRGMQGEQLQADEAARRTAARRPWSADWTNSSDPEVVALRKRFDPTGEFSGEELSRMRYYDPENPQNSVSTIIANNTGSVDNLRNLRKALAWLVGRTVLANDGKVPISTYADMYDGLEQLAREAAAISLELRRAAGLSRTKGRRDALSAIVNGKIAVTDVDGPSLRASLEAATVEVAEIDRQLAGLTEELAQIDAARSLISQLEQEVDWFKGELEGALVVGQMGRQQELQNSEMRARMAKIAEIKNYASRFRNEKTVQDEMLALDAKKDEISSHLLRLESKIAGAVGGSQQQTLRNEAILRVAGLYGGVGGFVQNLAENARVFAIRSQTEMIFQEFTEHMAWAGLAPTQDMYNRIVVSVAKNHERSAASFVDSVRQANDYLQELQSELRGLAARGEVTGAVRAPADSGGTIRGSGELVTGRDGKPARRVVRDVQGQEVGYTYDSAAELVDFAPLREGVRVAEEVYGEALKREQTLRALYNKRLQLLERLRAKAGAVDDATPVGQADSVAQQAFLKELNEIDDSIVRLLGESGVDVEASSAFGGMRAADQRATAAAARYEALRSTHQKAQQQLDEAAKAAESIPQMDAYIAQLNEQVAADLRFDAGRRQFPEGKEVKNAAAGRAQIASEVAQLTEQRNRLQQNLIAAQQNEAATRAKLMETTKEWYAGNVTSDAQLYSSSTGMLYRLNVEAAIINMADRSAGELKRAVITAKARLTRAQRLMRTRQEVSRQAEIDPVTWLRGELNDLFENPARAAEARAIRDVVPELYTKWAVDRYGDRSRKRQFFDVDGGLMVAHRVQEVLKELMPNYRSRVNTTVSKNLGKINRGGKLLRSTHDAVYEPDVPRNPSFIVKDENGNVVSIQLGDLVNYLRTSERNVPKETMEAFVDELDKALRQDLETARKLVDNPTSPEAVAAAMRGDAAYATLVAQEMSETIFGTQSELGRLASIANQLRARNVGARAAKQQDEIDSIVAEIERLTGLSKRAGSRAAKIAEEAVATGRISGDEGLAKKIRELRDRLDKYDRQTKGQQALLESLDTSKIEELKRLVDDYDDYIASYDSAKARFGEILSEVTGTREQRANLAYYRAVERMQATSGVGLALDRALAGGSIRSVNDFFAELLGGTVFDPRHGYRTSKIIDGQVAGVIPVRDEYVNIFTTPEGRLVDGAGNTVNTAGQRLKDNGEVLMEYKRGPSGRMENVPVMGLKSPYPTKLVKVEDSVMGRARKTARTRHSRVNSVVLDGTQILDDTTMLPKAEASQAVLSGLDMLVGRNGYLAQMRLTLEILEKRIADAKPVGVQRAKSAAALSAAEQRLQDARQADAALPRGRPQQRIETLQRRIQEAEQSEDYMIADKRRKLNEFIVELGRYNNPEVFDYVFEFAVKTYDEQIAALRQQIAVSATEIEHYTTRFPNEVKAAGAAQQRQRLQEQVDALVKTRNQLAAGFPRTRYRGETTSPVFDALFRPKLDAKALAVLDKRYKELLAERRRVSAQLDRTGKRPLARATKNRLETKHDLLEEQINDIIRERTLFYSQYEQLQLQGVEVADRMFRMLESPEFQRQLYLSKKTTGPETGVTTTIVDEANVGRERAGDVLYRILGGSSAGRVDESTFLTRYNFLQKTFYENPENKVLVRHAKMKSEVNSIRSAEKARLKPLQELEQQRDRLVREIAELDDEIRRLDVDGFIDDLNESLRAFWGQADKPAVWQVRPGGKTPSELTGQARKAVAAAERRQAKELGAQKYYDAAEELLGSQRAIVEGEQLAPAQARRRELVEALFNLEVLDFVSRQEMNDLVSTLKVLMNLTDKQVAQLGIDIAIRDPKTGRALTGAGSTVNPVRGLELIDEAIEMLQAERKKILSPLQKQAKQTAAKEAAAQKRMTAKEKKLDAAQKKIDDATGPKSSKAAAVKSAQQAYDNSVGLRGAGDEVYKDVEYAVSEVQKTLAAVRAGKAPKGKRDAAWEASAEELLNTAFELFDALRTVGYLPEGSVGKAAQKALADAPAGQADFLLGANKVDPATLKVVAQYVLKKKEALDAMASLGEARMEVEMLKAIKAMAGDTVAVQQYIDMFGELPGMTIVKTFRDGMVEIGKNFPNSAFVKEYADMFQNVSRLQEPEIARLMGQFLGPYTRMFKAYATLSPGFHIRNAMHNAFMLFAAGVDIQNMRVGAGISKSWTEASGRGIPFEKWLATEVPENLREKVRNAMLASWSSGGGMTDDALRNPTPFPAFLTGGSKRLGRWIEQHSRFMMAFDAIEKGADIAGAAGVVRRHLFDYENISNADRVMRQFVPFWMWTSRNLPLQIQLMWTNPKPYQIWSSFKRNIEDKENDDAVPLWMREIGGFKLPVGDNLYATPDFGFNRVDEMIGQLRDPKQLLSQMNPALRVPIELSAGTQFFGNRRFSDTPMEVEGGASTFIQPLLEALGYGETGAGGKKFVNERAYYALRNLLPPVGRLESMNPTTPLGRERANINPLLGFLGSPVKRLTPEMQEGELVRIQRALQDVARRGRIVNAPQE